MIDITIRITGDALSDNERALLTALAGPTTDWPPARDWRPPSEEKIALEKQLAKEAEEQPKRTRRTKAEMEAARAAEEPAPVLNQPVPEQQVPEPGPEPAVVEPEPEVVEPVATDDPAPEATLDDAVRIAVKMVADGRNGEIKEFLKDLGIKRVSELKGDGINKFVAKFS